MTGTRPATTTARALLGCALLAGVHLLALTVLAAQLTLLVAVLTTRAWPVALLGSLTVASVSTLAHGLLAGTSGRTAEGPRIVLTPQQQPELWSLTLQLAEELETAPPTTLRLADDANACAGERSRLLGLVGGPRTLDLGLPLFLGLTRDELHGVLCHELGHYAGGHTRLAAVSHRGSLALERAVRRLEVMETDQAGVKPPVRLLLKVVKAYRGVYLRQTFAVRRRQELEADAAAARTAGARTFAQALRAVHGLAVLWDEFRENRARPRGPSASTAGTARVGSSPGLPLPDGLFRDFADRIAEPPSGPLPDSSATSALDADSEDALSSHPPLAVRLAALGAGPAADDTGRPAPGADRPAPAAGLLRDLPGLTEALQEVMRTDREATAGYPGGRVRMEPPRFDKVLLRTQVKTALIGTCLILGASAIVHAVVFPPPTDPPAFSPPPGLPGGQNVLPEVSTAPRTPPTFTVPPLPPPGRLTPLPLLPVG
ncbi:M48 family metalloprotease [Streptomyces asoensis]|uniref:M48 family metallopeptidase n=1 Tax=Streptomyces asoensis TaxID=249586 RepID=UPI0033DB9DF2